MHTDIDQRFGNLRLDQARDVGAEILVTSCPYCVSNFEESRLTLLNDETVPDEEVLQIRDLTEVVLESLEGSEETP